jgi:Cof subfamily protein (haloacid dehalogenase superfamily)
VYKLIAVDIDGTLSNDDKVITKATREALINAQKQGIIVVIASGRQAPGLERESRILKLEQYGGLLLSYNGARIINASTREIIYENSIDKEYAITVLKELEKYQVNPIIDDGEYIITTDENSFMIQKEKVNNNMKVKLVDNLVKDIYFNPCKILIAAPHEYLISVSDNIISKFEDKLTFTFSTPFFLEANNKGISKAAALEKICEIYNITKDEVIAFGDGGNDLSMIKFAGMGVAMGNAVDELKEAANMVTLSNNDDGIVYALNQLLKKCV